MNFHLTDTLMRPGRISEELVWHALQKGLRNRIGEAIWHFPIFSCRGKRRKEPDFVILDPEFGILVIEVKGFNINNIIEIQSHRWVLVGVPGQDDTFPMQQVEDAAWALASHAGDNSELRNKIPIKVAVALPNISQAEWEKRSFGGCANPAPYIIFSDHLPNILSRIKAIEYLRESHSSLDESRFGLLKDQLLGCQKNSRSQPSLSSAKPTFRSKALELAADFLHQADMDQMRIAMEIPPGFQQIRGISGSGKTLLLCQKAATMHLKCPDWKVAFVFFTQSLYEQVRVLIDNALRHQSCGQVTLEAVEKCGGIQVLHAWGSTRINGFYRSVAKAWHQKPQPMISGVSPAVGLATRCRDLLESVKDKEPIFDVVLIDESQDLISGEKIEGQEPFFSLAYHALKPIEKDSKERRLIWAYDEAQSLDSMIVPKAKEILGEDFKDVTKGYHEGGMSRSHVMKKCYRTPGPILIGGAALGMGLLRKKGMVSGLTDQKDWKRVGYETTGTFYEGNPVSITRPEAHSPNPIPQLCAEPKTLAFNDFRNSSEEAYFLATSIQADIRDGIAPHQILLLVPHTSDSAGARSYIAQALLKYNIPFYLASADAPNSIKKGSFPERFRLEDHVTISYPFRAKGNEAQLVYLTCLQLLEDTESNPASRNQIFVCMSRAKGWCQLTGTFAEESIFRDEIKAVVDTSLSPSPVFSLTYRKPGRSLDHDEVQLELPI